MNDLIGIYLLLFSGIGLGFIAGILFGYIKGVKETEERWSDAVAKKEAAEMWEREFLKNG